MRRVFFPTTLAGERPTGVRLMAGRLRGLRGLRWRHLLRWWRGVLGTPRPAARVLVLPPLHPGGSARGVRAPRLRAVLAAVPLVDLRGDDLFELADARLVAARPGDVAATRPLLVAQLEGGAMVARWRRWRRRGAARHAARQRHRLRGGGLRILQVAPPQHAGHHLPDDALPGAAGAPLVEDDLHRGAAPAARAVLQQRLARLALLLLTQLLGAEPVFREHVLEHLADGGRLIAVPAALLPQHRFRRLLPPVSPTAPRAEEPARGVLPGLSAADRRRLRLLCGRRASRRLTAARRGGLLGVDSARLRYHPRIHGPLLHYQLHAQSTHRRLARETHLRRTLVQ